MESQSDLLNGIARKTIQKLRKSRNHGQKVYQSVDFSTLRNNTRIYNNNQHRNMLNSELKHKNQVGFNILPLISQAKNETHMLNTMSQGFMLTGFKE